MKLEAFRNDQRFGFKVSLKQSQDLHTRSPWESLVLRGFLLYSKPWDPRWRGTLVLEVQPSQNWPGKDTQNVQHRSTRSPWWNQIPSGFPPLTSWSQPRRQCNRFKRKAKTNAELNHSACSSVLLWYKLTERSTAEFTI